jgi:hypothetical protein
MEAWRVSCDRGVGRKEGMGEGDGGEGDEKR